MSFSLDEPVNKNQILNSGVYFSVVVAKEKRRDSTVSVDLRVNRISAI